MEKENNIFKRFDEIVENAGKGLRYAKHCYLCYLDMFTSEERNLIDHFKKYYKKYNNNIKVLSTYNDKQIYTIDRFIEFAEDLPRNGFTGWLRWLFSRRRVARKREMEKRREKEREIEFLESVRKNGLITELDYQLQLKKLDYKYN